MSPPWRRRAGRPRIIKKQRCLRTAAYSPSMQALVGDTTNTTLEVYTAIKTILLVIMQGLRNRYGYSTALAVPWLWRMRLSRTTIGAILMTSLRLVLALTPAAQDDKRGENTKYHRSAAPTKTRAAPSTLALSQGI